MIFLALYKETQRKRQLMFDDLDKDYGNKKAKPVIEQKRFRQTTRTKAQLMDKNLMYYVFKDHNFRVNKYDRNIEWCTEKYPKKPGMKTINFEEEGTEEGRQQTGHQREIVKLSDNNHHVQQYDGLLESEKLRHQESIMRDKFSTAEHLLFTYVKINQIEKLVNHKPPFTVEVINKLDRHHRPPLWYAV